MVNAKESCSPCITIGMFLLEREEKVLMDTIGNALTRISPSQLPTITSLSGSGEPFYAEHEPSWYAVYGYVLLRKTMPKKESLGEYGEFAERYYRSGGPRTMNLSSLSPDDLYFLMHDLQHETHFKEEFRKKLNEKYGLVTRQAFTILGIPDTEQRINVLMKESVGP